MFLERLDIVEQNLQKGINRWFEQDLQQRGRTQKEMKEMTLNFPTEQEDTNFFLMTFENFLNKAFQVLLERTRKELIQKWAHEGGKKDFAIGVTLEILKERGQLDNEEDLKTSLQNIDDWQTLKKLVLLAALMSGKFFTTYTQIIERYIHRDDLTKKEILRETRILLILQLGVEAVDKVGPIMETIDDLQELKKIFIAAARALNLATFKEALPQQQETTEAEVPPSQQQET